MIEVIGVDLGGRNLRACVVSGNKIINEYRSERALARQLDGLDPEASESLVISELLSVLNRLLKGNPDVASIGLGIPGFIDYKTSHIISSPNLPGLHHFDLAGPIHKALDVPVFVENDALAACWGEYMQLNAAPQHMAYLGLGTGIGAGLILNERPFHGEKGVAMEFGHLVMQPGGRLCGCGNRGCLERYASASGVSVSYAEHTGRELDAADIAELAQDGDAAAQTAFEIAGEMLARALVHLVKILDIRMVVIGGGLTKSWALIEHRFQTVLDAELLAMHRGQISVDMSRCGDQSGMLGAALLATERLGKRGG